MATTQAPTEIAAQSWDQPIDGTQVIARHAGRLFIGEVVDREQRPTIDRPNREILTVEVTRSGTTIQVLERDAKGLPPQDEHL